MIRLAAAVTTVVPPESTQQAVGYPSLFLLVLIGALVPVVPTGALVSSAAVVAGRPTAPLAPAPWWWAAAPAPLCGGAGPCPARLRDRTRRRRPSPPRHRSRRARNRYRIPSRVRPSPERYGVPRPSAGCAASVSGV